MKLTIVAATGGIGRQILHQAIAAGHDVTAVVRNATQLSGAIRIVTADLAGPDPAALESAVAGADAVLSGLGPRSKPDAGIAARPPHFPRRCRPSHAARARGTRDDQAGHRNRELIDERGLGQRSASEFQNSTVSGWIVRPARSRDLTCSATTSRKTPSRSWGTRLASFARCLRRLRRPGSRKSAR